ncbi:MAG: hypothetical protein E6590_17090, partial [Clostridiales bacterium]|nr:hypothetical protein [Clostridiales bacterium]
PPARSLAKEAFRASLHLALMHFVYKERRGLQRKPTESPTHGYLTKRRKSHMRWLRRSFQFLLLER